MEGKKPPFASSETLFSPGQTSLAELQVWLHFDLKCVHFSPECYQRGTIQNPWRGGKALPADEGFFKNLLMETSLLHYWVQIVPLLGPFSSAFSSIESQLLEVQFLATCIHLVQEPKYDPGKLKNSVPSLRSRSVCQIWKEPEASHKAAIQTLSTQVFGKNSFPYSRTLLSILQSQLSESLTPI